MVNISQVHSKRFWLQWWASGAVSSGDPDRDRSLRTAARSQLGIRLGPAELEREGKTALEPRGAMRISEKEISEVIMAFREIGMVTPAEIEEDPSTLCVGDQIMAITRWGDAEPEQATLRLTALEPSYQSLTSEHVISLFEALVLKRVSNSPPLTPDHDPHCVPGSKEDTDWPEEAFGLIVGDGRCMFFPGSPLGSRLFVLKAFARWNPGGVEKDTLVAA